MTKNEKTKAIIKEIIETIVITLVLVILIRNFIGEPRWIPSASMRPTLMEGDRIFIEKITGFFQPPQRGDIIVFYPPSETLKQDPWSKFTRLTGFFNNDIAYIKRVIGTPGDLYEFKGEDGVYINHKKINEPYINPEPMMGCRPNMYCDLKIPAGYYFMMGDNRNNSNDSRYWGLLPKNRIIGKACFRFWPINRIGVLTHPKY